MKKHFIWVLAVWLLLGAIAVGAQENKLGLGLVFKQSLWSLLREIEGTIGFEADIPSLPPSIIDVPMIFGNLKLEPEFGLLLASKKEKGVGELGPDDTYETSTKSTALRLGCGVFVYKPVNKVSFYYGGRVGIVRTSNVLEREIIN